MQPSPAASNSAASLPGTRSRFSYVLVIIAVLALVGGVAYYGLSVIKTSTFNKERAFRVLGEVAEQFQNLQDNLVGLLSNVPERLKDCTGTACEAGKTQFSRKLDLKLALQNLSLDRSSVNALCAPNSTTAAFVIHSREPNLPFELFSCSIVPPPAPIAAGSAMPSAAGRVPLSYGLKGDLTPSAQSFISQSFFDEVLIAMDDGHVIAELPRSDRSLAPGIAQLHESKVRPLSVTDAARLLGRATQEVENSSKGTAVKSDSAGSTKGVSIHPVVFPDNIAGQPYDVFVVGFRLAHPTIAVGATGEPGQCTLYLIGLKRTDLRADIVGALGPGGTFAVTIFVALIFFSFPLVSLRLKPAHDPVTWTEAAGCVFALLLMSALLAVTAFWLWSQQELTRWADDGSRSYAHQIRQRLVDELGNDAVLLNAYRQGIYRTVDRKVESSKAGWKCWEAFSDGELPVRVRPVTPPPADMRDSEQIYRWPDTVPGTSVIGRPADRIWSNDDDSCNTLQLQAQNNTDALRSWSPLRSNLAVLDDGKAAGPRVTVYAAVPVKRDLDLSNRPYFKALEREQQWSLPSVGLPAGEAGLTFVAQRLFNRGDGARVLQIAVPRQPQGAFEGLVSGDSRVHGLTAAIAPLFLRFAVIDREGAVLFHWDDSRSVTENFLVEAEGNSLLRSAVLRGEKGHFAGNYAGEPHRFFYLPLEGVPWGVVVFYPTGKVTELSSQAGISALVAYAAAALLAFGVFVLLAVVVGKDAVKKHFSRFWPRAGYEHHYEAWGVAAALGTMGFMLLLAWPNGERGRMLAAVVIVLAGGVLVAAARFWRGHAYAMCISMALLFTAALPATGLALRYHDAQLEAAVRDGLSAALEEVTRRHAIIAHDLRRWEPVPTARDVRMPDAWILAEHPDAIPVPGFEFGDSAADSGRSCNGPCWQMTAFAAPPWAKPFRSPQLNDWMQFVWANTASSASQRQRSGLLHDARTIENWKMKSPDGHDVTARAQWRGTGNVGADRNGLRWTKDVVAALIATVVILLLSAMVSRRLLGSRVAWPARHRDEAIVPEVPATVIYYRGAAGTQQLRASTAQLRDLVKRAQRQLINLATDERFGKLQPLDISAGAYLLTDLDMAIIEPVRRQQILAVLERIVRRDDIEPVITAHRSALRRLHRPEMYPEFRPGDAPDYAELIRWDSVLAQFSEVRQTVAPGAETGQSTAKLAAHHRAWKLCTRDERLALYQLATGKLANPENADVIGSLIRHGLVDAEPRPQIADPDFSDFVCTAEAPVDIASWQRDASRTTWKSVRAAVIGGLLVLVLILVIWFSWAGGETFKVFTTVIVGAMALLGHLTNAFNFVRTPAKS